MRPTSEPPPNCSRLRPNRSLSVLLVAFVLAAYGQILTLPLVQDDWGVLESFANESFGATLLRILSPHQLFFRPLALLALRLEHGVFGIEAAGYHALGLALHATAALLVVSLIRVLTGDDRRAFVTGFLYAACTSVHLDTMTWAVGIYELGATCGALACLRCVLAGNGLRAGLWLLVALLCRESAVATLPAAAAIALWHPAGRGARSLRFWTPMLVVTVAYAALKLQAPAPFGLPADHPYAAALFGPHLLANLRCYATWSVQALIPFESPFAGSVVLLVAALGVGVIGWRLRHRVRPLDGRSLPVFAVWALAVIAPLLVMRHHAYRYYLSLALPALLGAFAIGICTAGEALQLAATRARGTLTALTAGLALVAASHLQRALHEGLSQHSLLPGTNHLVRRAMLVELARTAFVARAIDPAAVVVLDGIDAVAFHGSSGPRNWTHDPQLTVCAAGDVTREGTGFRVPATATRPERHVAADAVLVLAHRGLAMTWVDAATWQPPPRTR